MTELSQGEKYNSTSSEGASKQGGLINDPER